MTTPDVPPIALAGEPDLIKRICDAIRAADNKSVDEALYMLDSDDCIKIIETFAAPSPSASGVPVARVNVLGGDTFTKWLTKMPDGIHDLFAAPANQAPSAPNKRVRLPDLSEELYEHYPAMSAQAHEAAVKEYARALLQANGATK